YRLVWVYLFVCVCMCVCVFAGCMQDGTSLGDVVLPPWAKGDPQEFIRIHREVGTHTHTHTHTYTHTHKHTQTHTHARKTEEETGHTAEYNNTILRCSQ